MQIVQYASVLVGTTKDMHLLVGYYYNLQLKL